MLNTLIRQNSSSWSTRRPIEPVLKARFVEVVDLRPCPACSFPFCRSTGEESMHSLWILYLNDEWSSTKNTFTILSNAIIICGWDESSCNARRSPLAVRTRIMIWSNCEGWRLVEDILIAEDSWTRPLSRGSGHCRLRSCLVFGLCSVVNLGSGQ
jgi:hypothetical protein